MLDHVADAPDVGYHLAVLVIHPHVDLVAHVLNRQITPGDDDVLAERDAVNRRALALNLRHQRARRLHLVLRALRLHGLPEPLERHEHDLDGVLLRVERGILLAERPLDLKPHGEIVAKASRDAVRKRVLDHGLHHAAHDRLHHVRRDPQAGVVEHLLDHLLSLVAAAIRDDGAVLALLRLRLAGENDLPQLVPEPCRVLFSGRHRCSP